MGLDSNELGKFFTWRNGLEDSDFILIYQNLQRLDEVERLVLEGADHDTIRRTVFELD